MPNALFKLDDTPTPGLATVKLLGRKNGPEARAVKAMTGFELWNIEVVEVVRPSAAAMKTGARPGQRKSVSAKHLIFQ